MGIQNYVVGKVMHEWALAESIVLGVAEYVKGVGGSAARRVVVSLGELQAIDKEVFEFALKELVRESPVKIGEIELIDEEAKFRCRLCGYVWRLKDVNLSEEVREAIHFVPEVVHTFLKCPKCGSRDYEVVSGRGVKVVSVEVIKDG